MRHEGNYLLVRHACWTDDANYATQSGGAILSGDDRKILEPRIVVLRANRDCDSADVASFSEKSSEILARLGKRNEPTHVVDSRKLRLFGKNGSVTEENLVGLTLHRSVEELLSFLDKNIEQLRRARS